MIFNKHIFSYFLNLYSKEATSAKDYETYIQTTEWIWPKLISNIQLDKRKLSKQQKTAAIYMTFYSCHYTDMQWTRGYQSRLSRKGGREGGEGRQKKCEEVVLN